MIDMVPKAIMLNLVQYVLIYMSSPASSFTVRAFFLHVLADIPRTKCNANCWKICTERILSTTCSRKVTLPFADGKNASRWSSHWAKPAKLSVKFSKRFWLV